MIICDAITELFAGAAYLETTDRGVRPHRLPACVSEQFPDSQLMGAETQPAGVRLRFRTASTHVKLITHTERFTYSGIERPRGAIDIWVNNAFVLRDVLTGGDVTVMDMATGQALREKGPTQTTVISQLPADEKTIEVWLPHNERTEIISLSSDAPILPLDSSTAPIWVHHGSSISQGSNAIGPSATWTAIAAKQLGADLRNLGFSGSAFVDQFIARTIRDVEADVISLKFGINVVNLDAMRLRTFVPAVHGFLDTIREGHPETPILLISPIYCGIHENTPGPGAFDPEAATAGEVRFLATGEEGDTALGRLTLVVIREALSQIVDQRRNDPFLHYLDGTQLYGSVDAQEYPLSDRLHPDTDTHHLIASRFTNHVLGEGQPFGSVFSPPTTPCDKTDFAAKRG